MSEYFLTTKKGFIDNIQLSDSESIKAPFENTQRISFFISSILQKQLSKYYKKFLNKNIFIVEEINLEPFKLLKSIEYSVEVFKTGKYFIHVHPTTKIISYIDPINQNYLSSLRRNNKNNSNVEDMFFNIINKEDNYSRSKVDLLGSHVELFQTLHVNPNSIASFDYHFIANYSPELFTQVLEHTENNFREVIDFLYPIMQNKFILPKILNLSTEIFCKVIIEKLETPRNLIVGSATKVSRQSAVFYNGIYKPVNNTNILILAYDGKNIDRFKELILTFNKNGQNLNFFDTINFDDLENIDFQLIENIIAKNRNKLLLVIFCQYKLTDKFFEKIKEIRGQYNFRYKIFKDNLEANPYKLSNFVCTCLEAMGGVISAIANTGVDNYSYFMGIDLGHNKSHLFSNLGMVLFNNLGIKIKNYVEKKIPLFENLQKEYCEKCFQELFNFICNKNLLLPKKIVIHRDGKLHSNDVNILVESLNKVFGNIQIDIVEIIKSGAPVFIKKVNRRQAINPSSGNTYLDEKNKYAILITNDQAAEFETILNPIIIKHKFGNTPFKVIVEQVYWFTKIYSNNIYYSSRLPATTQLANDIAKTVNSNFL